MPYRRNPLRFNRYRHTAVNPNPGYDTNTKTAESKIVKQAVNIPLPNEAEKIPEKTRSKNIFDGLPFINFFKQYIHADDIILIGLIFLLLDERRDNRAEDDLLLILLVYIFLSGME